jgi:hypothetical protein
MIHAADNAHTRPRFSIGGACGRLGAIGGKAADCILKALGIAGALTIFLWSRSIQHGYMYSYMAHVREYDAYGSPAGLILVRTSFTPPDDVPSNSFWGIGLFKPVPGAGQEEYRPYTYDRKLPSAQRAALTIPLGTIISVNAAVWAVLICRYRKTVQPERLLNPCSTLNISLVQLRRLIRFLIAFMFVAFAAIWVRSFRVEYVLSFCNHGLQFDIWPDRGRLIIARASYNLDNQSTPLDLGNEWILYSMATPPLGGIITTYP